MAGIFRDGFDTYDRSGEAVMLRSKYTQNGSPSFETGRFGTGRCIWIGNSNSVWGLLDADTSTLSACCGVKVDEPGDNVSPQFGFATGITRTIGLQVRTGGYVVAYRRNGGGWVELGRSRAGAIRKDTWYTMEVEIVTHATAGRLTVWLDGNLVLNLTNTNTDNGVGFVNTVILGTPDGGGTGISFDDLYITDSATKPTQATRIVTLPVNSDGAVLNFVPSSGSSHSALIGEIPASASNYISATNVGDRDILGLANLPTIPASIEEVAVVGYLAKTDAPTRAMHLGVISGNTTVDGPAFNLNASGFRHEHALGLDPATGAKWTPSAVDALQLQPKVAS